MGKLHLKAGSQSRPPQPMGMGGGFVLVSTELSVLYCCKMCGRYTLQRTVDKSVYKKRLCTMHYELEWRKGKIEHSKY